MILVKSSYFCKSFLPAVLEYNVLNLTQRVMVNVTFCAFGWQKVSPRRQENVKSFLRKVFEPCLYIVWNDKSFIILISTLCVSSEINFLSDFFQGWNTLFDFRFLLLNYLVWLPDFMKIFTRGCSCSYRLKYPRLDEIQLFCISYTPL